MLANVSLKMFTLILLMLLMTGHCLPKKDQLVRKANKDLLVMTQLYQDQPGLQVKLDHKDHKAKLDHKDHKAKWDHKALRANKALREHREMIHL